MPTILQERTDRVMVRLGVRWPFFCQMLASQTLIIRQDIPTLATNGASIFINEDFFLNKLNDDTQVSGMAHELVHVCLEHMWRRGPRDPVLFNIACDFKVNQYIEEEGFIIPGKRKLADLFNPAVEGWLRDSQFDTWSEEQIYNLLEDEVEKQKGSGKGKDKGKGTIVVCSADFDDLQAPPGATKEEVRAAQEKVRGSVIKAYNVFKAQGQGKGLAERLMGRIVKPREKWFDQLRRYMTALTYHEYDWTRMNRRELTKTGIIMPDMRSESLRNVVVGVDLSGSIGEATATYFGAHMNAILEDCKPELMAAMYFDDGVDDVIEYTYSDLPMTFKARGGGGTDFRPVFAKIEECGYQPDVLIMLTDTFGAFPDIPPDYPVIWASIYPPEQVNVPFGELVYINEEDA
jgi:predicted metal-dependent peptidase